MSPQGTEDWMELAIPTDGVEVSPTAVAAEAASQTGSPTPQW